MPTKADPHAELIEKLREYLACTDSEPGRRLQFREELAALVPDPVE